MPNRPVSVFFLLFSPVLLATATALGAAEPERHQRRQLRRPVALEAVGGRVYVANRRSGSISTIDARSQSVVREVPAGGRLADLAALPDGRHLLAVDDDRHRLVLFEAGRTGLRELQRLAVPHAPVSVEVSRDGRLVAVASLWSRRLTLIRSAANRRGAPRLKVAHTVDLPFSPRRQTFIADDRYLVAADAFGGRLAILDPEAGRVGSVRSIPGHNIGGLAVSADGSELHVAHQILNSKNATTHERVFWGGVMKNVLRSIPIRELLSPTADERLRGSLYHLGNPGGATGDPGAVVVTSAGRAAVSLSGVHQVAVRGERKQPFLRRATGRRPTALAVGPDGKTLYVAGTLDDSIGVIDFESLEVTATIPLGPQPELSPADRGELLFYDARLSLDGWYSCHSCHTDGHSNGLLNDNFGDNYFGDPKRVPSLLGTGDTAPWAWNGSAQTLRQQIRKSITVTMQGDEPSDRIVGDLAAYLRTLAPPAALSRARQSLDEAAVGRGRGIFHRLGCADCHSPPTYTSSETYDVGLADKKGNRDFNPPSLRGVGHRRSFFHDGRAKSLREVFTRYRHNVDGLPEDELEPLLEFLQSL